MRVWCAVCRSGVSVRLKDQTCSRARGRLGFYFFIFRIMMADDNDLADAEVAHLTTTTIETQNPIYRSGSGNLTRTRTTLDFVNLTYLAPSPTLSSSSSSSSSNGQSTFSDVSPVPGSYAGPKRSTSSPVFGLPSHDTPKAMTLSMTYACWRPPKLTSSSPSGKGKRMCYGHMPADKTVFCHLCNAPSCPLCRTVCPSCRYIVCLNCVPEGQVSCCRRCIVFETGVTATDPPVQKFGLPRWINKTLGSNILRPIAHRLTLSSDKK